MNQRMTPRMHKRLAEQSRVEIDYDKLAEAVAKAIVREEIKEREKYSVTREWMKFIFYPVLILIGILMAGVATFSFYKLYLTIPLLINSSTFDSIARAFVRLSGFFTLGLFSISICFTTFWANKELGEEKDRQYVASVLSNITAIVALVVALIALLKDVI